MRVWGLEGKAMKRRQMPQGPLVSDGQTQMPPGWKHDTLEAD